ncbi:MAG: NAD-dependent epimerase/dehydratase family protein, partial [Proteobacteria bacterium]|nr:NAD-dependent epimerase/dehydratase family protein [Pseudomonadota bacterium]
MLLITGAAGFIGSNVVAELNMRGIYDIICVDDLTDGRKCLNLVGRRFADYIDWHDLHKIKLPHISGIIHLGAISDTTNYDGRALMQTNYEFSKRMLELAEDHECPIAYASSASVYGDGEMGFRENPENEMPKSPYAFSKWVFDQYVRRQLECRKVNVP